MREIGLSAYIGGLSSYDSNATERELHDSIAQNYVGPDMYWAPPDKPTNTPGLFGTAIWLPFPPTLVREAFKWRMLMLMPSIGHST